MKPVEWPSGPWCKIAVDMAGKFKTVQQHQRFLLVALDLYLKWPEVMLHPQLPSFLHQYSVKLVDEIINNNGKQLISAEFELYLSTLSIKHCHIALYNPQGNGAVERLNRVLKDRIKSSMIDGCTFEQADSQTLATYRSTRQCTTGVSPAKLINSFDVQMPTSHWHLHVKRLKPQTTAVQQLDRTQLKKRVWFKQDQMASRHDGRQSARLLELSLGDFISMRLLKTDRKLAPSFSEPREVQCQALSAVKNLNVRNF